MVSDPLANYQHVIDNLTLTTGVNGTFEVKVDDELVYSKKKTGRHARDGEILGIFRDIVSPDTPVYGK